MRSVPGWQRGAGGGPLAIRQTENAACHDHQSGHRADHQPAMEMFRHSFTVFAWFGRKGVNHERPSRSQQHGFLTRSTIRVSSRRFKAQNNPPRMRAIGLIAMVTNARTVRRPGILIPRCAALRSKLRYAFTHLVGPQHGIPVMGRQRTIMRHRPRRWQVVFPATVSSEMFWADIQHSMQTYTIKLFRPDDSPRSTCRLVVAATWWPRCEVDTAAVPMLGVSRRQLAGSVRNALVPVVAAGLVQGRSAKN